MVNLNLIIAISLAILAFFSFCLFVVIIPIVFQMSRTLSSAQHLLDTINDDLSPAVKEIKQGVDNIRTVTQKGSEAVRSTVNDAGVVAVSSAYGVLVGIKDYLSSYKNNETGYNNKGKESQYDKQRG